jgi:hypothetical protein
MLCPLLNEQMQSVFKWLQHNKEWVFSGCGITAVLAFWGVFRLLLSRKSHVHISHLRVNMTFGFVSYGPEHSGQMLLFTVTNIGGNPSQIAGVTVRLSGNRNLLFHNLAGERRIPCFIDPGTSLKFWTDLKEVQLTLSGHGYSGKIRAVVTDGTGVEYQSNSVRLGR